MCAAAHGERHVDTTVRCDERERGAGEPVETNVLGPHVGIVGAERQHRGGGAGAQRQDEWLGTVEDGGAVRR